MKNKTLTLTPEAVEIMIESLEMNLQLREDAFLDGDGLTDNQIQQEERFFKVTQKLIDRLEKNS
jgi:Asp-tRNA(Asn)/Glu-tRNA(Gln) amidotransferase C subunit